SARDHQSIHRRRIRDRLVGLEHDPRFRGKRPPCQTDNHNLIEVCRPAVCFFQDSRGESIDRPYQIQRHQALKAQKSHSQRLNLAHTRKLYPPAAYVSYDELPTLSDMLTRKDSVPDLEVSHDFRALGARPGVF